MDLLSSFAFLATAQKAASVPETLEIKGLADGGLPFKSLLQVPAGPGESAPELIGQRLVLPGDAGKGLPLGGQSLPEASVGGNNDEPVASKQQIPVEQRGAPVTRAEAAPEFFGKDRIEAFAAPARRADAPAEVPDDWSGRADFIREEAAQLGPQARRVAAPLPITHELPAAIQAADVGSKLASSEQASLPHATTATSAAVESDLKADADRLARQAGAQDVEVSTKTSAPAVVSMPVNIASAASGEKSPGHGGGVSLDDFPRTSAAVLPGDTGKHPGPWLNAAALQHLGSEERLVPGARTGPASVADRQADTGPVPVLRRKVRIQTPDNGLGTRVELARTPASHSVAAAPVRPPETGNPAVTHRAQALVDAMPRIRTHRRIPANGMSNSALQDAGRTMPAAVAHNKVQAGSATGREIPVAPNGMQERAAQAAGVISAAPAHLSSKIDAPLTSSTQASRAELPNVKAQSVTPGAQVARSEEATTAHKSTVQAQRNSIAEHVAPAAMTAKAGSAVSPNMTAALSAPVQGSAETAPSEGAVPQAGRDFATSRGSDHVNPNAGLNRAPGMRPKSVSFSDTAGASSVSLKASEAQATPAMRAGMTAADVQPEIAARYAATLNRIASSAQERAPQFVTDKGAAIESVRIAAPDAGIGASAPATTPGVIATDSAAPQFRLAASPGGEQWSQALGERVVLMLRGGQQVARLILNPEHLGALEVQVRVQDEQALVTLQAQSPQAREALENALPRLREMLAEQGLDLARDSGNGERRAQDSALDSQRRDSGADWQQAKADEAPGDDQENRRGGHDGLLDRYI